MVGWLFRVVEKIKTKYHTYFQGFVGKNVSPSRLAGSAQKCHNGTKPSFLQFHFHLGTPWLQVPPHFVFVADIGTYLLQYMTQLIFICEPILSWCSLFLLNAPGSKP
jgi:hypothetical protein